MAAGASRAATGSIAPAPAAPGFSAASDAS